MTRNKKIVIDEWLNCYPSNWKGLITEDALGHPAKFSSKLIRRIYDHIVAEGWVEPGSRVVDPFGGVALGALDATRLGLSWTGCELETRFVEWGNANIALWNGKFSRMPRWSGDAVLLQGDSRKLAEVLRGAQRIVSSPPFSDTLSRDNLSASDRRSLADELGISNSEHVSPIDMEKVGKRSQKGYAATVSSPPYAETRTTAGNVGGVIDKAWGSGSSLSDESRDKYGVGESQLGAMKATAKGFEAAVSSPPYNKPFSQEHNGKRGGKRGTSPSEDGAFVRYGDVDGQLEGLPDGDFQQVVSSPPFLAQSGGKNVTSTEGPLADASLLKRHAAGNSASGYGGGKENMGSSKPEDFWSAAREIVEQVYLVLEPGGHASWVVKNYVKGGKEVQFCEQWKQLCESVGFVTLHEHHATFTRNEGLNTTDFTTGKKVSQEKRSVSFFRRVAEKKGAPPINFEVVLCMEKPL